MQTVIAAENKISNKEHRYLWISFCVGMVLFIFSLMTVWLWDGRYAMTASIGVSAFNTIADVMPLLFNPPRERFVRGMACVPLLLSLILTVTLQCRDEVKQVVRDKVATETNELARQVDALQRFLARNTILSEEEEAEFAQNICSTLDTYGYTNSCVWVSANGDYFCLANADGFEDIFGWILKREVPIMISKCENGDYSKVVEMLKCPPLPGSEFENWRDDCREVRFSNQSKLGVIGAVVVNNLNWLGVNVDLRVDAKAKSLIFTFKGESSYFVLDENDIDELIDEQSNVILLDILPSILARQGFLGRLHVDSFQDMLCASSYVCLFKDGVFQEITRSQLQGIVREKFVSAIKEQAISDKFRAIWQRIFTEPQ